MHCKNKIGSSKVKFEDRSNIQQVISYYAATTVLLKFHVCGHTTTACC